MFDQLIESEPEGADFHNRRTYFLTSSVVVGILFLSAVVISIYAADFSLGNRGLELAELLAPVEMAATEPEPVQPRMPASTTQSRSELPTRTVNMIRIDENPIVPTAISTVRNKDVARPYGEFKISTENSGAYTSTTGSRSFGSVPTGPGLSTTTAEVTKEDVPPPPPVKKDPVVDRKPPAQSLGVINGKASYLPKPIYSQAAIAMRADGKVDVQVTIDESGRVISAKAVSGNILLRPAAEQAARDAKFTTTYLSNVAVKVTGVIVYNFTR